MHGAGDWGFIASYVDIARRLGTAFYVGEGTNVQLAISHSDAATLYRLGIERPTRGALWHGAAERLSFVESPSRPARSTG